jgi:hypothetical protein
LLFASASPPLRGFAGASRFDPSDSLLADPVLELQGDDLRALPANLIGHGRAFSAVLSCEDVRRMGGLPRVEGLTRSPLLWCATPFQTS